jgi:hypothetical protein
VEGLTFRPTVRQLVTTVFVAALVMAGGVYAVVVSRWYSFGGVWAGVGGVLLLVALSTLTDRTRLDADGISVRRFLVYRFSVRWAWVDAVEDVDLRPHRRGRGIVISTLIGQSIMLPAPVHLTALPDPRFAGKAETLVAFTRSAAAARRVAPRAQTDRGTRPRLQARGLGQIRQQPRTGVREDAPALCGRAQPGTQHCSVHLESAPVQRPS